MMTDFHRPLSDSTNVPRPSRRPCAAPSRSPTSATTQQTSFQSVARQPSPALERSISPLGCSGLLATASVTGTASLSTSACPSSVTQLYERMNAIMLEMNMLMAQWDSALKNHSCTENHVSAEAFKGMLSAFGTITSQYALYQQAQQTSQERFDTRPPAPTVITTVHQSAGGSRCGTISPDQHIEKTFVHQQSPCYRTTAIPAHGTSMHSAAVSPNYNSSGPLDLDRDCIVAVVEFKRQRMKRFACAQFVEPGQYVIVDGDRGKDCGFVVYCSVRNADGSSGPTQTIDNSQFDVSRIKAEHGIVRGLACDEDIARLHGEIATNERMALKTCRELVEQMKLPMKIADCEYQFDCRKISFYFESDRSIDFRALTTELYRIFGVRIWLENQNNKVKNVVPDGAFSHNDRTCFPRNGMQTPTMCQYF